MKHLNATDLLSEASTLRSLISGAGRRHGLLAIWQGRHVEERLRAFAADVQSLSDRAVRHLSPREVASLLAAIDAIGSDVDAFVSGHVDSVRLSQHMIEHTYTLQQSAERIADGMSPNPNVEYVSWEERTHPRAVSIATRPRA